MLPTTAFAADATPAKVYTAVKKAYGKSFPLSKNAKSLNPKAFGISKKKYTSYYAKYKGNNKSKYMIFIAKADKNSDVRAMKKAFKIILRLKAIVWAIIFLLTEKSFTKMQRLALRVSMFI